MSEGSGRQEPSPTRQVYPESVTAPQHVQSDAQRPAFDWSMQDAPPRISSQALGAGVTSRLPEPHNQVQFALIACKQVTVQACRL